MAFSGIELEEPVGEYPQSCVGGGNFVYSIDRTNSTPELSIMNTSINSASLYTPPIFGTIGYCDYNESIDKAVFGFGYRGFTVDSSGSMSSSFWIDGFNTGSAPACVFGGIVLTEDVIVYHCWYNTFNPGGNKLPANHYDTTPNNEEMLVLDNETFSPVGTRKSHRTHGLGRYNNRVFRVYGKDITEYEDVKTNGLDNHINVKLGIPENGFGNATRKGDWLWWKTSNLQAPIIGYNVISNTTRLVSLTPTFPNIDGAPWYQWAIDDNDVAYRINEDNETMLAIDLNSGRWKIDDLPTIRSGRYGVAYTNNKLWIPSTVTP